MAFWGIEVKPGKPITHLFDETRGRLRISQATLGFGSSTKKSLVQCNIGDKCPVLLCVLLPDKTESCHLDLEFEEAHDVVFSVVGPRSIYLTGYYVGNCRRSNLNDDSESFGEDIANTESEQSSRSNDDEYEDSFIDDDEPEAIPDSPVSSDRVDGEMLDNIKAKDRKSGRKRLKKKYQSVESDDDDDAPSKPNIVSGPMSPAESEDDDKKFILSVFKDKKTAKNLISKTSDDSDKLTVKASVAKIKDVGCDVSESKGKVELVVSDCVPEGKKNLLVDRLHTSHEVGAENGTFTKKRSEEPYIENGMKYTKKKRKERSKEVKTPGADNCNHNDSLKQDKGQTIELDSDKRDQDQVMRNESDPPTSREGDPSCGKDGSEEGPKKKKKRKESGVAEKSSDVHGANGRNILKERQAEEDFKSNKAKDPLRDEHKWKLACHETVDADSSHYANEHQTKEKKSIKKKKKSKSQEGGINIREPLLLKGENSRAVKKSVKENKDANSSQVRTLSSGLVIEELERSETEGKVAAPGKKIKIHYVGMLKQNGEVFDSTTDKAPIRLRLGDKDVIEGWNIGLNGMQVGDKRRLVIPPSMGFGSKGTVENIPPNSWLIYEVKLLGIH